MALAADFIGHCDHGPSWSMVPNVFGLAGSIMGLSSLPSKSIKIPIVILVPIFINEDVEDLLQFFGTQFLDAWLF